MIFRIQNPNTPGSTRDSLERPVGQAKAGDASRVSRNVPVNRFCS
jgi:hypothetical protein